MAPPLLGTGTMRTLLLSLLLVPMLALGAEKTKSKAADKKAAEPKCEVQTPDADVTGVEGGLPCSEAEALAKKLKEAGLDAKVVPVKK